MHWNLFERTELKRFALFSLFCTFFSALAVGQDSQVSERVVAKPAVSAPSVREGSTFVAIDPKLKRVFDGREPKGITELRLLDEQQSKVAAAIEKVTVNVQQGSAQGSGVIITEDGYVLTAAHVAGKPGRDVWVMLSDGQRLPAKTLGMNRDKDAGLIKISKTNAKGFPHATLGMSAHLREGQWCIAAGHPGGWQADRGNVIRVGRISQVKSHTLFTDCTLIGGDSGGPLFDLEGKLIGIHSRIGTEVADNMHVPVDVYAENWERLKKGEAWGTLPGFKPMVGISGPKDPNDPPVVSGITPQGPAFRAGVVAGALILSFDGIQVKTFAELQQAVQQSLPGETVTIEIELDGRKMSLPITVGLDE
jgi:serine protease Do